MVSRLPFLQISPARPGRRLHRRLCRQLLSRRNHDKDQQTALLRRSKEKHT